MKGRFTACFMLLLLNACLLAAKPQQPADTTKPVVPLWWYSLPRSVYIDHTMLSGFKEEFKNDKLTVKNDPLYEQNTRIMMTVPFLINKKGFTLTSSVLYNIHVGKYNVDVDNVRVLDKKTRVSYSTAASLTLLKVIPIRSVKLILRGSVSYIARQIHEPQRVTGVLTAMVSLRSNAKERLSVGITGIIDNRSPVPVLPVVSYFRRMKQHWNFELLLPSYLRFRKIHNASFFTLLGVKLDNRSSYYTGAVAGTGVIESRNNYVKAFVGLEKRLYKAVWVSFETGYLNRFSGKFTEPDAGSKDYLVKDNFASNVYMNVGLFIKPAPKVRK